MSARRILVVDDSPFIGKVLSALLHGAGFDVTVAYDLWDLERWGVGTPDLVLMDVVLQEAFGDDVAILLRARGWRCPIVLMSSLPEAELEQRAADAGLDGFVSKHSGLAGIVELAQKHLGCGSAAGAALDARPGFEISARQRLRRVIDNANRPQYWNSAAVLSELRALVGDADMSGRGATAAAARVCHDVVHQLGANGATQEILDAIDALGESLGTARAARDANPRRILLLLSDDAQREALLAAFDRKNHVVVEARSLVEARQKLHAATYDLVLVDVRLDRAEPSLITEVRKHLPEAPLAVLGAPASTVGVPVISTDSDPAEMLDEIERTLQHGR